MDQLFAFLKSIIEENWKELYKRLFRELEGCIPDDNEDDDDFYIIEKGDADDDNEVVNVDKIDHFFYDLSHE